MFKCRKCGCTLSPVAAIMAHDVCGFCVRKMHALAMNPQVPRKEPKRGKAD